MLVTWQANPQTRALIFRKVQFQTATASTRVVPATVTGAVPDRHSPGSLTRLGLPLTKLGLGVKAGIVLRTVATKRDLGFVKFQNHAGLKGTIIAAPVPFI